MKRSRSRTDGSSERTIRRNRRRLMRARRRQRTLLHRAPARALVLLVGVIAALATAAATTGYFLAGAVTVGVAVVAWLILALRVSRLQPAGPGGDGPAPPGGAGVREPRRPVPLAPAGAAAMPLPEE